MMGRVGYAKLRFEKRKPYHKLNLWLLSHFPISLTLKLTFKQKSFAPQKCTETGIKGFGISVSHHDIKQETYISLKCCMECYELETLLTNECPKQRDYKICSEWSSEGHVWHQCQEAYKKYINYPRRSEGRRYLLALEFFNCLRFPGAKGCLS